MTIVGDADDDDTETVEVERQCIALNGETQVFRADVPLGAIRVGDTVGDVYCRVINASGTYITDVAEIGIAEVTQRGVMQAVDIFGLVPGGEYVVPFHDDVTLCLLGRGDYLFISATSQPRTEGIAKPSGAGGGAEGLSLT